MKKKHNTIREATLSEEVQKDLEFHPLCTVFPEMNEEEYDSLVESIRENGFLPTDPVIIYYETDDEFEKPKILDGRNRYLACMDTLEDPKFVEYTGNDPSGFVLSRNMDRRHLSTGQKAAIASKIATMGIGENQFNDGTTREEAAKVLQTTTKAIQRFRYVQKHNPELAEEVASGSVTLNEAEKIVKRTVKDDSPILNKELKYGERADGKGLLLNDNTLESNGNASSDSSPPTGTPAPAPAPVSEDNGDTTSSAPDPFAATVTRLSVDYAYLTGEPLTADDLEMVIRDAIKAGIKL